MALSTQAKKELLQLLLLNQGLPGVGDSTGLLPAGTVGNVYVALHTASPGGTGDQTISEIAYTGYARQPIARSTVGITLNGTTGQASNALALVFPALVGGAQTVTDISVGTLVSGAGLLLFDATLPTPQVLNTGDILTIPIGDLTIG